MIPGARSFRPNPRKMAIPAPRADPHTPRYRCHEGVRQNRQVNGLFHYPRFYNPVFFEFPGMEYLQGNRPAIPDLLRALLVHNRIMPQAVHSKVRVNGLEKCDLLREVSILVLLNLPNGLQTILEG